MAVEAVGNVGAVGNMLNHAVFLAELRNLQAAEAFRRRAVDGLKIAVRLLVFRNFIIDML